MSNVHKSIVYVLFVALGLFQTQTFYIKQPLATNFYPLPMIAESFNIRSLQLVSPTFTVIFSSFHKKPKVEMDTILIEN